MSKRAPLLFALSLFVLASALAGLPSAHAQASCGSGSGYPPNWVSGRVYGYGAGGSPMGVLAGATVAAVRSDGYSQSVVTQADGVYSFILPAGTYTLTASHPDYAAASNTFVADGSWSCGLNFYLDPPPSVPEFPGGTLFPLALAFAAVAVLIRVQRRRAQ